jgi:hypothetical protein
MQQIKSENHLSTMIKMTGRKVSVEFTHHATQLAGKIFIFAFGLNGEEYEKVYLVLFNGMDQLRGEGAIRASVGQLAEACG